MCSTVLTQCESMMTMVSGWSRVEHLVTEASQTGDETDLVAVVELSAGRFVEHEWVRGW
jgi:hypothetical protein